MKTTSPSLPVAGVSALGILAALAAFAILPAQLSATTLPQSSPAPATTLQADQPPVPVKKAAPDFPHELRRNGISGVCRVECLVDETGEVREVKVIDYTHSDFVIPAIEAARKWKFTPAKQGGIPVRQRVAIPFRFDFTD